jgi:hypothetical protein
MVQVVQNASRTREEARAILFEAEHKAVELAETARHEAINTLHEAQVSFRACIFLCTYMFSSVLALCSFVRSAVLFEADYKALEFAYTVRGHTLSASGSGAVSCM